MSSSLVGVGAAAAGLLRVAGGDGDAEEVRRLTAEMTHFSNFVVYSNVVLFRVTLFYLMMKVLRLANPRTRAGIRLLHTAVGVAAGPVGKAVGAVTGRGLVAIGGDDPPLPDYPDATRRP